MRRWQSTPGQLLLLGVRELGASVLNPADQAYVPDELYPYVVDDQAYRGREISVWKMSASGSLNGAASFLPKQI